MNLSGGGGLPSVYRRPLLNALLFLRIRLNPRNRTKPIRILLKVLGSTINIAAIETRFRTVTCELGVGMHSGSPSATSSLCNKRVQAMLLYSHQPSPTRIYILQNSLIPLRPVKISCVITTNYSSKWFTFYHSLYITSICAGHFLAYSIPPPHPHSEPAPHPRQHDPA